LPPAYLAAQQHEPQAHFFAEAVKSTPLDAPYRNTTEQRAITRKVDRFTGTGEEEAGTIFLEA
jgi:hypothetical protein